MRTIVVALVKVKQLKGAQRRHVSGGARELDRIENWELRMEYPMTGRSVLLLRIAVLHGGKLRMDGWLRCYTPGDFAISNLLTIIGNIHLLANNLRVSVRWSRVAAARQVLMWPGAA